MMLDDSFVKKMPVGIQTVLGFVLMCIGAYVMIFGSFWANGNLVEEMQFYFIGVLFLVAGVPSFLTGGMTMLYKKSQKEE